MGVRVALTSEVLKKPGQLRCVQSGVRSVCAASVSAGRCVQGPSKPIPTSCATADHRLGARHAFWTAAADTGSVPSGRRGLYRTSQRARQSASFFPRSNVVRNGGSQEEVFLALYKRHKSNATY